MPDRISSYLRHLSAIGFYGTVTLRFDQGRIVLVVENRSIKPEDLPISAEEPKLRNRHDNLSQ